jgi:hypothetical protein
VDDPVSVDQLNRQRDLATHVMRAASSGEVQLDDFDVPAWVDVTDRSRALTSTGSMECHPDRLFVSQRPSP